jgi:hypothetical protein
VTSGKSAGSNATKKACCKCGMTNHLAKERRASESKIRKYKEEQKNTEDPRENEMQELEGEAQGLRWGGC